MSLLRVDEVTVSLQGGPEQTAQSLNIATVRHSVTRFSPKCSEINK